MKKEKLSGSLGLREIFSRARKNLKWQGLIVRSVFEAVVILLGIGYLFYDSPKAGLILFPYVPFHIKKRMNYFEIKRREKTELEFKDGMQAVVAALTAGYSIENAFREALSEIALLYGKKSDLYLHFSKMVNKMSLNMNIEDVFEEFSRECNVEEISRFSQVLTYAKKSGGNLIAIIRNTTDSISEKIEVKRDISSIISAKKLEQSIMNMVPMGIILYMRLTSGDMFDKLYGNALGITVMTVCLLIYLAAKLMADRIVDIKM